MCSLDIAEKMINPSFRYDGDGFRRSSSNSSLNSILSPEGELHLRTCIQCRSLLERRDQQIEQRNTKALITQLYEVLTCTHVQTTTTEYAYKDRGHFMLVADLRLLVMLVVKIIYIFGDQSE